MRRLTIWPRSQSSPESLQRTSTTPIRDRMRLCCQTAPLVLTGGLNVLLLRTQVALLALRRFAENMKRIHVRNDCGLATYGSRAMNAAKVSDVHSLPPCEFAPRNWDVPQSTSTSRRGMI